MQRSLVLYLRRRGATDEEIERAEQDGYLTLLVFDRSVLPGQRKYSLLDVARQAGTDPTTMRALWRAIGFPDVPDDLVAFTDADVAAVRGFIERLEEPWLLEWSLELALRQARVFSSELARIADAESDDIARQVRAALDAGVTDEALAERVTVTFRFEDISRLVDHAHRLQLRAALWRKLVPGRSGDSGAVELVVGFVDLVGYTRLSEDLDDEELGVLVERFGSLAHDTVVVAGGRIVKTIGDEVMFVADSPVAAADIALRLSAASERDPLLPEARAGLASGSVLSREGDYYGPVVNLASRLTELAYPGTVLVSDELGAALDGDDRYQLHRLHRRVRGIGRIDLYRLGLASQAVP